MPRHRPADTVNEGERTNRPTPLTNSTGHSGSVAIGLRQSLLSLGLPCALSLEFGCVGLASMLVTTPSREQMTPRVGHEAAETARRWPDGLALPRQVGLLGGVRWTAACGSDQKIACTDMRLPTSDGVGKKFCPDDDQVLERVYPGVRERA